ncbi:hypothetical protein [Paenibacillus sp. 1781tsa1]|uniref:hypothetical protein n=1 Tax=Paenibacillus sp. 1781tsa1 TaxID=2953810 RepID=UPI00209FE267|nr:hypothetical protein [Paenibacillus sp. 1781tsa1]MCP1186493.1 hypothetical protein [Paenibacillus sp. 1781tsa1]
MSKADDECSFMDEVAQYEKDNPINFDLIGRKMLKQAERRVRSSREKYRFKNQLRNITHNEIKDHVGKMKKLFSFTLVKIEATRVKGRIDILEVDRNNRYVGVEIKKFANKAELGRFQQYNKFFFLVEMERI